jgi:hypothetical protein
VNRDTCTCGASGAIDGLCGDCAGKAIQDLGTIGNR